MSAVDGFAITMLGIIVLTLGMIVWMLFFMLRGTRGKGREQREVDDLLKQVAAMVENEEQEAESSKLDRAPDKNPTPPADSPWEKSPDWWKKS